MFIVEPRIRGLIFDCDGTLADTMPIHYRAWQETVEACGGRFPEKLFYELAGVPSDKIVMILNEKLGYQFDPETLAGQKELRFLENISQTKPIEPVVAVAKKYKGQLPMAVATGGVPGIALTILRTVGLENFFDTVVTALDVAHGKPAPDIFLEAARRLDVPPDLCQVFEDADLGLEGARRAGMVAVDIRPVLNGNYGLSELGS